MSDTEDLQTYYTLLDIEESATPGEGEFRRSVSTSPVSGEG
jgi:hypothetical protein